MDLTNEEINRRIHLEVMNEKCWHEYEFYGTSPYGTKHHCGKCNQDFWSSNPSNPDYCASIADAWRVLEKLRESGYSAALHTPGFLYAFDSGMYQCQLSHATNYGIVEKDESMERAICLAVIRTIDNKQMPF